MKPITISIRRGVVAASIFALGAFSPALASHDEASRKAAADAAAAQNAAAQNALNERQKAALDKVAAAFHLSAEQQTALEELRAAFAAAAAQTTDLQVLMGMETAIRNVGPQLTAPIQGALQTSQAAVQGAMTAAAAPELFSQEDDPAIGQGETMLVNGVTLRTLTEDDSAIGQGETIVAEFFDYQCGYCKRMFPAVVKAMEASKVRVVVKEFPILGPNSVLAAEYALAADRQGKYAEFHEKLMTAAGRLSPEFLDRTATDLHLDVEKLKADAKGPEVQAIIARNRQLARALQITGTPAFFVGETPLRGAVGEEQFLQLVEAEKAKLVAKNAAQ